MDKKALKQRYGKSIQIEISVKGHGDDDKAQQTSDLAPTVKDSDEPGVEKGDIGELNAGSHKVHDMHTPEADELEKMIALQPKGSAMSQSLHGRAREKMTAKHESLKKGLKV